MRGIDPKERLLIGVLIAVWIGAAAMALRAIWEALKRQGSL